MSQQAQPPAQLQVALAVVPLVLLAPHTQFLVVAVVLALVRAVLLAVPLVVAALLVLLLLRLRPLLLRALPTFSPTPWPEQ